MRICHCWVACCAGCKRDSAERSVDRQQYLHDLRLVRHLKTLNHKPWLVAALVSWGIALFEYLLQVPANRIGHTVLSVGQLKI